MRRLVVSAVAVAVMAACGSNAPTPKQQGPAAGTAATVTATVPSPGWVNRIWRVQEGSDIPPGSLYVFLSDSTLLITSSTATPAIGRWTMTGNEMVMIEEGMSYRTEILEQSAQRLVLRQHNPGGTVRLVFAPARTGN